MHPELKVVLDKSFGKGVSQHFVCLTAQLLASGACHTCSGMALPRGVMTAVAILCKGYPGRKVP